MQRRHIIMLANKIRNIRVECESAKGADKALTDRQFSVIINELADLCQYWNKDFNRTKFKQSCHGIV